MVLNYWAQIKEPSPENPAVPVSPKDSTSTSPTPKPKPVTYVLRPLWQRASLVGFYVTAGLFFGIAFFQLRSRYVQKLHLVLSSGPSRGSGKGRTLIFQTCADGPLQGHVVPLNQCKIKHAEKDKTSVFLKVEGTHGVFRVGTAGAKIGGKDTPPSQVFDTLVQRGILGERLRTKGGIIQRTRRHGK